MNKVPFNKPYLTGLEEENLRILSEKKHLSGDGEFTKFCNNWIEKKLGCEKALLTHSCTAALEMAAILIEAKQGDEIIMPSYTFVSTANAFSLRGAIPVFVDIDIRTCNIDADKIEEAITINTKAIVVVHYAGVAVDMDRINEIAKQYNLYVIEDAAQALMSEYKGKKLGTFGEFGTISFHETKNIISGEGGAIMINDKNFINRSEIIREKGTNRSQFYRGKVDKYTWVDIGSSYLPSEIIAAFLKAQLINAEEITEQRKDIWNKYHIAFDNLEKKEILTRPHIPDYAKHNAHMYFIVLNDSKKRDNLIHKLDERGISSVFHYIPLHSSPYGVKNSIFVGSMKNTEAISSRLLRLPLWIGLDVDKVLNVIDESLFE